MKIAVAAEGKTLNSEVSEKAGRAPYILIIENGELKEAIKNAFAVGGGGAGWSVAYMIAEKGAEKFIASKVGGNMQEALEENNITFVEKPNKKVEEIINEL